MVAPAEQKVLAMVYRLATAYTAYYTLMLWV